MQGLLRAALLTLLALGLLASPTQTAAAPRKAPVVKKPVAKKRPPAKKKAPPKKTNPRGIDSSGIGEKPAPRK